MDKVGGTSDGQGRPGKAEPGKDMRPRRCGGHAVPGVLEVLLVVVAVEDREAEHAACDLLGLLLKLGQVLLGIICKSPGR